MKRNNILTNIYVLKDPRTEQVRYVGKANNIESRLNNHIKQSIRYAENNLHKGETINFHKAHWILSLLKDGLKPIVELVCIVPVIKWGDMEKHYIKLFKSMGAKLVNETAGGDCGAVMYGDKNPNYKGKAVSDYQRKVARESAIKNLLTPENLEASRRRLSESEPWNKGKKLIGERYSKGGKSNIGKIHSAETKALLSSKKKGDKHPMFGRKMSEEPKQKMRETIKQNQLNKFKT